VTDYQNGRFTVTARSPGGPPDPCWIVLDYANDPAAHQAARHYANSSVNRSPAVCEELTVALDGGQVGATLRTHDVTDVLDPPGARYLVLDCAHSYPARVALLTYAAAAASTSPANAAAVTAALAGTAEQFRAWCEHLNARTASSGGRRKRRP